MAVIVGYLLILTLAALRAPRRTSLPAGQNRKRFAIVIPAHNEELLLPDLLTSLGQQQYPPDLFSVHVIADNCSDRTEAVARVAGAQVHTRINQEEIGKGYALQWLLDSLLRRADQTDAVAIIDADTVVSPNFLEVMSARLARGERAIQAYYAVRDPESAWSGLRYAALAVLHYLRPQARMVLGGSAGLKGNGMVFAVEVLNRHRWSASITEDIEYHMALLLEGERVTFAPDAIVWGEMPNTLAKSQSQHTRWEQGRLEMARRFVPQLLRRAVAQWQHAEFSAAFRFFDAAMEHLIPPLSVVISLNLLGLLAALILFGAALARGSSALPGFAAINLGIAAGLLLGQVAYVFAGLALAKAPRKIYLSLLYAPLLVLWKIGHYLQVLFRRNTEDWVRTTRNEVQ